MKPIIRASRLGKRFRIGDRDAPYATLRETMTRVAAAPLNRARGWFRGNREARPRASEHIWALRDVEFEVRPGEVVGLIGRNGAGKSTLLKVLSRVTEPTEGTVELYGRVGGLLEVGTGFHPELTGRENVYLNGAILGMSRREIARKFDEIVAFAEIDRLLDTPVKRYSNGMFVRLAFAVAAHLDPEILVVDEVLSVGDSAFQRKCLGRIRDIAGTGKAVLLVTHHMTLCEDICNRAIHLRGGRVLDDGPVGPVVRGYLSEACEDQQEQRDLSALPRRSIVLGGARLLGCRLASPGKEGPWSLPYAEPIELMIDLDVERRLDDLELGLALCAASGVEVASSLSIDALAARPADPGRRVFRAKLPNLRLAPGSYSFGLGLQSKRGLEDYLPFAVHFDVASTLESTAALVHLRRGSVIPQLECCLSEA